jgi:glutamate-1-semialdehyde 2,1-aminomutase
VASAALHALASQRMPGGVSSPVRAFRHVGGTPVFFREASGASIVDEDGQSYLDFCMAFGPLILGHAHPSVVEAVQRAASRGLVYGACHRYEGALAERVLAAFPYADLVRFVVSGTEAVATAIRLARAATRRRYILRFTGCYHGHVDALMVKAAATDGDPAPAVADSDGVLAHTAADTLVVPLANLAALEAVFARFGHEIAGAIVEPLPANTGLLAQHRSWLQRLRALTGERGALLIFDEVISGFRLGFGGYAQQVGVEPDLTTLGKIIGGGLPVGAVAGRAAVMRMLAPLGGVYQAGTMAGNPVALAAGLATLDELSRGDAYAYLQDLGALLDRKLAAHPLRRQAQLIRVGSIVWPYFAPTGVPPTESAAIEPPAIAAYNRGYHRWLARGVYLPPAALEVCFLSTAHKPAHLDTLLDALAETEAA